MDAGRLNARANLLGPWLKQAFGRPAAKIGLSTGLSCPNRDGTLGSGGCLFCPPSGAGQGGENLSIAQQLERGLARLAARKRVPAALAYFQAHTSTHAPPRVLEGFFRPAALHPDVAGLIISTRPDCLDAPRWELLADLARHKPLWLELGLQSAHPATLKAINRGHDADCFARAVAQAEKNSIQVVTHVILGLPGEGPEHCNATADFLAGLPVWGVKLHNLMVLAGSALAGRFLAGSYKPQSRKQYASQAGEFIARLRPDMVLHRLAADPGADRLLAPDWAGDKDGTLSALADYLETNDLKQGDKWRAGK